MTVNDVPQIVDKTLGVLSQRFGTTGGYLWSSYVKYVMANGLGLTLLGFVFVAGGIFTLHKTRFIYEFIKSNCNATTYNNKIDTTGADIGTTIVIVVCGILIILGLGMFFGNLPIIIAPDGAALQHLFEAMKSSS